MCDNESTEINNKINRKEKLIVIGSLSIIIFLLIFSIIFALININNEKILNKVSIMGIDVGNMTVEEAKSTINEILDKKFSEEIILKKDEYETSLNATQINAEFDVENAVNEAYKLGRNGNIVSNNYSILWTMLFGKEIDCNLNYNKENLDKKIKDISAKLPGIVVQSSYYIEDENLIIVKGTEGLEIKKDELVSNIINEINNIYSTSSIISIPTENVKPDEIDIQKIRNEI